ncbi:peptidoglycan-binding protein, partial [Streptomyces phyllanthi]|nr:peptidoglycan-binding protein [Streptomyces phyllanthi]
MSEVNGNGGDPSAHVCPECAAPRATDGSPSCPCGPRAAEALRDARTAEAAAAEDFDPLRIRPYVELGDAPAPPPPPPSQEPGDTPTLAIPVTAPTPRPNAADVHLFEGENPETPAAATNTPESVEAMGSAGVTGSTGVTGATGVAGPVLASDDTRRSPRRRHRTTVAVAGAVATVLAAAGFATGLFSYDTPTRDRALPDDLRASAPDTSPNEETEETATSGTSQSTAPSANTSAGSPGES